MPYKSDLATFIADWWQFGAFIGAAIVAFLAGKERQRFKVDQIGKDLERLSLKVDGQAQDIEGLKAQGNAEAVTLAQIVTSQGYIVRTLDEIKDALRGKADK